MNTNKFVTKWVIDTVKEKYPDDIALVVSHSTLNLNEDEEVISYFVPITERGNNFAQTFILEGRGYDIWGISWERLENFAMLKEYNITVLADSKIIYSRTPEDAKRFETLKEKQLENIKDEEKSHICALESYAVAKYLFQELIFAEKSSIRLLAGYILDYLSRAIAFENRTYFKHSQISQLEELKDMEKIPDSFCEDYLNVIKTDNDNERILICRKLITEVSNLLERKSKITEKNFQDLSSWYAELSYTWLRLRHYAEKNDPIKVHMWAILLQNELDEVCSDFGIQKMELLSYFKFDDLSSFIKKANELEIEIRNIITKNGAVIHEYKTAEDFLNEV